MRAVAVTVAAAACAAGMAAPFCCAYGGDGSAFVSGTAVFALLNATLAPQPPSEVRMVLATSTDGTARPFAAVVLGPGSDPNDSLAGWLVAGNATGQALYIWNNPVNSSSAPFCATSWRPASDPYVTSFSTCVGGGTGFPTFLRNYTLADVAVSVWQQPPPSDNSIIDVAANGCQPVAIHLRSSPFSSGAASLSVEGGGVNVPPAYGQPPSYCRPP